MELIEVKVQVPSDKVADFHRVYADWFEKATKPSFASEGDRKAAAQRWWTSLTSKERAMFGLWIDNAGRTLAADQIVEKLRLGGPRDIPGILAWPSRKADKAGFTGLSWTFRIDQMTGQPEYGIEDLDLAALLVEVRNQA